MSPQTTASVRLKGIPVSPGIHYGRVIIHDSFFPSLAPVTIPAHQIERQVRLLETALVKTRDEIQALREKIRTSLDEAHAAIFDSHLLFVEDPAFKGKVIERIALRHESASYAVMGVIQDLAAQFAGMQDAYISSRATDVFDVGNRICKHLTHAPNGTEAGPPPGDLIVFARDLSPSDTAQLDHRQVKAFAMEIGGPTSHTAILAKGLEIPAVVGLGAILHHVDSRTFAIVDGYEGSVTINPSPDEIKNAKKRRQRKLAQDRNLKKLRELPAETMDGYRVELSANIEFPGEIPHVLDHGANGVGLFRTEFLYFNRAGLPTEEEQFDLYKQAVQGVAPASVIFRTLDVGGDKRFSSDTKSDELNPFLGLRAIRYCLQNPDLFKAQLRALLRASAFGRAKLMFPMVSTMDEVNRAKILLKASMDELTERGKPFDANIEVGIMIEIPSAALIADQFAPEVDFFSIGTNDLIQYTLAVDRGNEKVADLYDPYHPAVLRLIRKVIDAAHRAGIWAGVCGEMASNPLTALLLVGMGIDELSMGSITIPEIKNLLRNIKLSDARRIASEVYAMGSSDDIRRHTEESYQRFLKIRPRHPAPALAG